MIKKITTHTHACTHVRYYQNSFVFFVSYKCCEF